MNRADIAVWVLMNIMPLTIVASLIRPGNTYTVEDED